jgi:hypothetical protein
LGWLRFDKVRPDVVVFGRNVALEPRFNIINFHIDAKYVTVQERRIVLRRCVADKRVLVMELTWNLLITKLGEQGL